MILVTGAAGQVGARLVRQLREAGHHVVGTDLRGADVACDLRSNHDVQRLLSGGPFSTVVHLAAMLPTAFRSDPLSGGEINLTAALHLLRAAVACRVSRIVFGSSGSVYGTKERPPCTEETDATPHDPYGAAKLAIEQILEQVASSSQVEAVSVRIARVVGPGATNTASPWRSQMFERPPAGAGPLLIPFAADVRTSVVLVHDLARALQTLVEAPTFRHPIYNAPAETVTGADIQHFAQSRGWDVRLGSAHGGPLLSGRRFEEEFAFRCDGFRHTPIE